MKNALAVMIQQKNDAQKKLIADVPSMIAALSIMIEHNIGSDSTQEFCTSLGNGYVKYGRLTDKQLPYLKNTILQHASDILECMNESATEDVESDSESERELEHEETPF